MPKAFYFYDGNMIKSTLYPWPVFFKTVRFRHFLDLRFTYFLLTYLLSIIYLFHYESITYCCFVEIKNNIEWVVLNFFIFIRITMKKYYYNHD